MELTYTNAEITDKNERRTNWLAAFGLQDVDNLKVSDYAIDLSEEHIEGNMTIDEVENAISTYYSKIDSTEKEIARQNEADIVSARIMRIINNLSNVCGEHSLRRIHKALFKGFDNYGPGLYRACDIIKPEWVLDNDTVQYVHYDDIEDSISVEFKNQGHDIVGITSFISRLWHIHPFLEGNTRTVAVFSVKYFRSLGYIVDNAPFENNAKYFRNALVRANYDNRLLGIRKDISFLVAFFENILFNKENITENRKLHINWKG